MNERDHSKTNRSKAHKIIVTIIVTLVASVTLWAIAHAVNDDGQRRGHRGGPAAMLSWHLDLSDDQEDRVEAIFNSAHTEGKAIRSELGSLRREVVESIRANGYQEDQVRIRIESETPKMVDLMLSRIRTMAEVYEVLTPEQQARVDEFIDEGPGFGRGRRHGDSGDFEPELPTIVAGSLLRTSRHGPTPPFAPRPATWRRRLDPLP